MVPSAFRCAGLFLLCCCACLRADPANETAAPITAEQATAFDHEAATLEAAGKFVEAFPVAQRAFDARQRLLGEHHLDTAASYYTMATIYEDRGDLATAQTQYEHALKIREERLGLEAPDVAQVLNAMGNVLFQRGQFPQAESTWLRALAIREKTAGPDAIDTAKPLNNLAALRQTRGDAAGAVEYYQRAHAIFEKRLGLDHPITANTLNNLGVINRELIGDLAAAEDYTQRALASREKSLGLDHPMVAGSLANLSGILVERGDYAGALKLVRRALAIYEKTNGPAHPDTIRARNNLMVCLTKTGQLDEAGKVGLENIRLDEKTLGEDHPQLASALMNLADLYRRKNQPGEAELLAARAVGIYQRIFGPDHPDTAMALAIQAGALFDLKQPDEAVALAAQLARSREAALGNVLSFTTEAQRLSFQSSKEGAYSLLATLGAAEPLEEAILRTKGAILDSLLEDRLVAMASTDPAKRQQLDEARAMRLELTKLQLETPDDPSPDGLKQRDARKRTLAADIETAEGNIARQVAGVGRARRALGVTVPEVRGALSKDAVLIDFVRYAHELGHDQATEERYGAVVLARDAPPKWIPLGSAAALDGQLQTYRDAVRGKTSDPLALEEVLGGLYRAVWHPLESALPAGTAQVFVSPDSELNFLSFATLLTPEDHFLAERHVITCLASGRDVLPVAGAPTPKDQNRKSLLVFANPLAGRAASALSDPPANASDPDPRLAFRGLRLAPLPGAEVEARELNQFARAHRWTDETLVGAAATERRLRGVHRPHVLHLATHGFFLPPPGTGARSDADRAAGVPPSAQWLNPMRRSGLALAGAGATLDAWAAGRTPNTEDDGIVTAEEISTLDLHGTWLVVLSACESGGGEARSGEGVLGLRRGFTLAGAQHLLLTLWPVGDEETAALILDFYNRAERTSDPARALAETQRDHLVRLRRDRGLNASVRLAGGFILSSVHQ